MTDGSNLHVESVFPDTDRRRAFRVIYRNVEIRTFYSREMAERFIDNIKESVR